MLNDTALPPKPTLDWTNAFDIVAESFGDVSNAFGFQLEWVFDFYEIPERTLK